MPPKKFYAIHGEPRVYFKWFGKGGAQEATKGTQKRFHGFLEEEAAKYYLGIPNGIAAQTWAAAHGKSKNWRDHAPKILPSTCDLPPFKEFLPLCPGLTDPPIPPKTGVESPPPSTPGGSPPPSDAESEFHVENEYDELFATDIIGDARQELMGLCVKIAQAKTSPLLHPGRLSLLWLQRAQASAKGAIAHFMKKILEAKDLTTAIPEYKALARSLQDNTWKYVYEVRDWLRKDVITAEVGADRSARLNEQHEGINLQLRTQILKLEGTVKELQYTIKTAEKRAKADFELGVVCSECKTADIQDYKAYCLTCLDCAIEEKLDLGLWPNESEEATTQSTPTTAATAATAVEIADELKEAEYRKEKEEDTRLEDIQHLVSLSLQKLKKVEEADRVAKEKAKLAFASIQVSPDPEATEKRKGSSETKKKKKKKKKKAKDLQELAKQQLQAPSKN
jgi:hypothetical protein